MYDCKTKKFYLHWNGQDTRIVTSVFFWILSPFLILLPLSLIVTICTNQFIIGLLIATLIVVPLGVFLGWYSFHKFKRLKNYMKDPKVIASINRTNNFYYVNELKSAGIELINDSNWKFKN